MHKLYERAIVVAAIDPDSVTTGTVSSDEVDMLNFRDLMVIVQSGDMESGATLDGTLLTGAATGTVTTALKTMTQLTAAGSDSDKQVILYARGVDFAAGHRYAKLNLVVTGTTELSAVILGWPARYASQTLPDLASVDEVAVA